LDQYLEILKKKIYIYIEEIIYRHVFYYLIFCTVMKHSLWGVTGGAGTAYTSGTPEFIPSV
jgi:hypothetical protein